MTGREILRSYNQAKNPRMQISIIADLNLCSKDEIIEVLEQQGIVFTGRKKENGNKKMDTMVYGTLVVASAKERSYRKYLLQATDDQIKEAIGVMEGRNCRDKIRILECKKELRRRRMLDA